MKKTSFETRQKAEDLISSVLEVWRQSDQSDYLEGLEDDPVFQLLVMAMTYQADEIGADIERLKSDVIDDFVKAIVPYRAGHAVPATVLLRAGVLEGVGEVTLNSNSVFTLEATGSPFIPILKTKAFSAEVKALRRIDARRWSVEMEFSNNVTDISGLAFAMRDIAFRDIKLSVGGHQLPLHKPWDVVNMPYSDAFCLDTMLFNRSQIYDNSASVMDLFDSQDIGIFVVGEHDPIQYGYQDLSSISFELELEGISAGYILEREEIILNPVLLANARVQETQLSTDAPIFRVGGDECQFLQIVSPDEDQIYQSAVVQVRKVGADRFNRSSLVKLLFSLTSKMTSDFYAFQEINSKNGDRTVQTIASLLDRLSADAAADDSVRSGGTYLLLKKGLVGNKNKVSVDVRYVTTEGAALNSVLNTECRFTTPLGLVADSTGVLAQPSPGKDEIDSIDYPEMARYYLVTSNRIVTPADIRLFCNTDLTVRYGISQSMIKSVSVGRRQSSDRRDCGYMLHVCIVLKDNSFVRRSIGDNPDAVALKMAKRMFARSAGIYPIDVEIQFTKE